MPAVVEASEMLFDHLTPDDVAALADLTTRVNGYLREQA
jgi:hypothetical protein